MKKLFTIAAATLVMFACNKTTEVDPTPKDDATLTLTLNGINVNTPNGAQGVASRSKGNLPTEIQENTITDMHVFMFDAVTKDLKKHVILANADLTKKDVSTYTTKRMTVTSGTQDVYVVLNAGSADFSSVTNVDTYMAVTVDLNTQSQTNLTMTGKSDAFVVTAGSSENKLAMSVSRLAAKVIVKWKIEDPSSGSISILDNGVYMINVPKLTNLRSGGDYTPAAWYYGTGLNKIDQGAEPVGTALAALSDIKLTGAETPTGNGQIYYYVFENKAIGQDLAPTNPTRIVFKATFTPSGGGAARDTYYIANVNKANANTTINGGTKGEDGATTYVHRNTVYTVTLNIKGEGMSDPWVEPTLTQMEVDMTIDAWAEISQEVDFE